MSMLNKQVFVAVLIFVLLNVVFVASAYVVKVQLDNSKKVQAEKEQKNSDNSVVNTNLKPPILMNQNPSVINVGEEYSFFPRLSDEDSAGSDLSVSILSGPSWLAYENGQLYGIPAQGDEGNAKVVLRLSDGKNNSDVPLYILVKKSN
jgi:hypothetical protein